MPHNFEDPPDMSKPIRLQIWANQSDSRYEQTNQTSVISKPIRLQLWANQSDSSYEPTNLSLQLWANQSDSRYEQTNQTPDMSKPIRLQLWANQFESPVMSQPIWVSSYEQTNQTSVMSKPIRLQLWANQSVTTSPYLSYWGKGQIEKQDPTLHVITYNNSVYNCGITSLLYNLTW
jgi:hypothetical protein